MRITPAAAERATFFVLASVASMLALFMFVARPGLTGHDRADFPEVIEGTAHRPYVVRVLVPYLVRTVASVTPESVRSGVERSLLRPQVHGHRRMV